MSTTTTAQTVTLAFGEARNANGEADGVPASVIKYDRRTRSLTVLYVYGRSLGQTLTGGLLRMIKAGDEFLIYGNYTNDEIRLLDAGDVATIRAATIKTLGADHMQYDAGRVVTADAPYWDGLRRCH